MIIFNNHVHCIFWCPEWTPPSQGSTLGPFLQGSLEASSATCSQALPPAQVHSVTVGSWREGERRRQVSLTTLPPSGLGRFWPRLCNHITDGKSLLASFGFQDFSRERKVEDPLAISHLPCLLLAWATSHCYKKSSQGPTPSFLATGLPGSFLCPLSHGLPPSRQSQLVLTMPFPKAENMIWHAGLRSPSWIPSLTSHLGLNLPFGDPLLRARLHSQTSHLILKTTPTSTNLIPVLQWRKLRLR